MHEHKLSRGVQISNEENPIPNQNNDDDVNAIYPLLYVEAVDEIIVSPVCQESSTVINAEPISWLHEEYDKETVHQEIWFDAEDVPPFGGFCADINDKTEK
ncbi:unnamed protein product [Brassicogethes aeneus]|uniref:Uncharacterized protein n=1 Tax=Brassicogethes aeneus TaxID=1431903 RepID=A0A9P0AZA1_BRAAE|nr:unnamed protein product [Brassicogethes aeneus]